MRSRDGNSHFSLSISVVLLFLLCSSVLFSDEYLISYRYLVKDATLYNESLQVSKAMKPCKGDPISSLILDNSDDKSLKQLITTSNTIFIEYIHKLGLHLSHTDITLNSQYSSSTVLTLKTTCFKVDFNDNFVKISPLK